MSVICQTFVQNTWRKDLCSNCFKSKDEHGGGGRGGAGGGGGKAREAGGDPGDFAFSRSSAEGLGSGVGGGSRRYMGVAGRVYQRGYYSKSWKSIMIEKSEAGLKSPGLIKEMSSRVSQENEKNLILSDMMEPEEKMGSLRSPRLAQQVRKTSQSEAKLLTEILADKTNREVDKERSGQEDKKDDKPSTKEDDRGDVSSDLGSEASHEGSTVSSGASSACSYEVTCSAANSDTASLRSEHGSEPSGEDKVDEGETKVESRPQEACEGSQAPPPPPPLGILKKTIAAARSKRGAISFNPKLEEIIGFGGDVDYSDDEDIFDDDDDDDDCDDLADLTPDERVLRQLTDKNTEFNSDNDNLKKDIEELLPSVKELEEKRKMIIAEIEELERLGRERMKDEKAKQEEKKDDKQEGKVKLKRSPPLVSTKPLIARNNNELRVNQVLPMKNGEVVRPGVCGEVEESPLKGIKPKYVAREEEMKEKSSLMEEELKTNMGKITSIDEVYHSEDTKKVKLTSIDDVCVPVIDGTVASAEVDDNVQAKLSNISSVVKLDERSLKSKNQIAEPTDSRKPVPSSSGSGALSSSQKGTSSQNSHKYECVTATTSCSQTRENKVQVGGERNMHKDVPVSMPRTSVTSHRQQQPLNSLTKTKVLENCKTLGPSETQKASSAKSPGGPKTPSPTERHTKQDTLQGTSGVSKSLETHRVAGDQRSLKSSQPTVQQSLSTSSKSSTEGRLAGNSKTLETKASSDITEDQSQPSSTEVAKSSTKQSVVPAAQMSSPGHLEVSKTRANKTSPVTSKAQTNQNSPEPSLSTSNQNLSKNDRVYNQSVPENSKIPSNQNLSKAYKTLSNQNLSEVNTSLSDQNISETSRTVSDQQPTEDSEVSKSLNQNPPEGPKTQSNQSLSETLKIQSNPNLSDTLKTPLNHSHPEASTTLSNQSLTEASRTSLDHSHPEVCRTSSNQSLPHNTKAPASRQGSNSSLMTTFGTPVVTSAQNSFLHSSSTRTMYDDTYSTPSSLHTPETTDFLKEIKSQPEIPALTAGIQKSALYASTSCLKGLPGAKPVITPKPPKLKDKPKVPFKPSTNSSRIYATPSPINPKVPIGNLSGAVSAPNLASMSVEDRSDTASTTSGTSEASSNSRPDGHPETMYKVTPEQKKPPPTTQAPAIPTFSGRLQTEVVYDVPVTLASSVSSMPKTDSPENLSREQKRDDATIYHEIDDSIRANRLSAVPDQDHDSPCVSSGTLSETGYSTASVSHQESTRCQSRSTFEANRSMLSAALDFGTKATRSSSSKRPAPRPPAEGQEDDDVEEAPESVELEVSQPSPVVEGSPKEPLQQERPQEAPSVAPDASNDGESYSSFTDDFDDDDEEEEAAQPTLRKAERSSSAVPFYRNSICPIVTHEVKGTYNSTPSTEAMVSTCPGGNGVSQEVNLSSTGISGPLPSKPQASRSHSVPRVADHIVNIDPSGSRGGPDIPTSSSSSKFSFGRSGFFRPSSPPTAKRDFDTSSSERGRDRSSKKTSASRFSLKKLLRLGSAGKDEEKKAAKEQEKRLARESKRNKLTIIHPLDYNQTGVEVIARPEKTSPIYDYTGIYGYIPPPQLSSKLEDLSTPMTQMTMVQASPALSLASKRSDASAEASHSPSTAAFTTPLPSGVTDVLPTSLGSTSSVTAISTASPSASPIATISTTCPSTSTSGCSSTTGIHSSSPVMAPVATSFGSTTNSTEKRGSYTRRDSGVERRESGNSHSSSGTASVASSSHHQHNLGYNSEGRPKPPPPPRKVSLESGQTCDIYSSLADLHTPVSSHYSTPTPIDTPSRPQRPPPPIRTPSNAGTKSGPPRPDPPKLGKDSVYANLGDVRAPIMPRKPGRTASIRGEDDREKRRAPQPPQYLQQAGQEVTQQTALRASRHQHEDSTSSSCSGISNSRAAKGPAPARPRQPHHTSNEYEAFGHDDATAFLTEGTTSTPSSRQEKTGRLSVRRGSAVTHRSLEDQYGAVMSANLEALSNMLDKLSNSCCPAGYEEVISGVTRWKDVIIDDDVIEGAGHRLFYAGVACGRDVTLMLTPEIKVDAHHLLTPLPIATFKDELPSHLLSHKYITRGKSTLGTVWLLPPLSLTTLRALAEEECLFSSAVPVEWERKACLLLLQLVTGLKQMQAQGVEETCIDLTLIAQGSQVKEQDSNPRLILIPPTETGTPLMSLCQCAAAATLLLMGVDEPVERAQEGNFTIPDMVPSPHAFNILLQLLHQEKAGSLTQVKCVLEVLLFGPDSTENDAKEGEEVEAALQRWLDLERATVLHSLIRGPLESSVLTKFHLLFLVRTNSRVLRETMKLLGDPEVTTF